MSTEEIYQTILRFLRLIKQGNDDESGNTLLLETILDELARAVHFVGDEFDPTHVEAPKQVSSDLWRLAEHRFPKLGFYNMPSNLYDKIAEADTVVGSAIEDIVDITIDLAEVLWRWDNSSEPDALWHFRFGYRTHWGIHLRHLQGYLHERINDI